MHVHELRSFRRKIGSTKMEVCLVPVCSGSKIDLHVIIIHHQNLHLGLGAVKKRYPNSTYCENCAWEHGPHL